MADTPQAAQERLDDLERMRRETDAILAESAALIARVEELLEKTRQLRLTSVALLEQRQEQKHKA
jgi:hypothetical protein